MAVDYAFLKSVESGVELEFARSSDGKLALAGPEISARYTLRQLHILNSRIQ